MALEEDTELNDYSITKEKNAIQFLQIPDLGSNQKVNEKDESTDKIQTTKKLKQNEQNDFTLN